MTLNGVMAVTLRHFTEFGKPVFQKVTASICGGMYTRTSLLYFVVRVRCRRTESSRSLSHLLMSFLSYIVMQICCLKFCNMGETIPAPNSGGLVPRPPPPRDLRPWAKSGKGYSANIIGVSSATYPRSDSYRDTSRELDSEVGYFIVNSYSYTSTRRPRQRQLSSRQENCLTSTVSQDEHDTASCSSSTRQPMLALIG